MDAPTPQGGERPNVDPRVMANPPDTSAANVAVAAEAPTTLPRQGRVAAFRELGGNVDEAQRAEMTQQAEVRHAAERLASAAHLWPTVNQILGVIQTDEQLSQLARSFELTRDAALDVHQRHVLEQAVGPRLAQEARVILPGRHGELEALFDLIYDELLGISVVGPFWRDDEVTEILIDGWDSVSIERKGVLLRTPVRFRDPDHARTIARNLALKVSDRALTAANPLVTAELPGARVAFAIGKVVKSGIAVAIRKFRRLLGMEGLMAVGALNTDMRDFLAAAVIARANIVVSGGTGTGKTTMINALSEFIPDSERVITIEDSYELLLRNRHWVALQTKEAASADDEIHVDLAQLLIATLRMRPDRVIVGEIREPKAAAVMLQAANTGHDGTMTTIHANSADRALNFRLAGMARTGGGMGEEVAAAEVAMAINVVVQVVRRQGRRFVSDIAVVDPTLLEGGLIRPATIFTGQLSGDGVQFARVGSVGADTELAMKMIDTGTDGGWVR